MMNSGDRLNPYYCHSFGTNLLRILKEFSLWTTVMIFDKTSVTTSARSEQYFNEVKNLIFKGMKNIRVDKFLITHIRSLEGTMKILNADNITTLSNEVNEVPNVTIANLNKTHTFPKHNECLTTNNNETEISHIHQNEEQLMEISPQSTFLNEIETWRDQKDKDSKRGKYLRICPDVDSIHNKPRVTSKIPLLQNGNILSPQHISGQNIMVKNTCAFDAIVQSLLVGFRDWITYHD